MRSHDSSRASRGGLSVAHLSVRRGGKQVVDGADFDLPPGAIAGLVGPNGAGKSTLLAAMAGLLPAAGRIEHAGAPPRRERTGYLPQAHGVRSGLTVLEALLLGRRDRLGWRVPAEDVEAASQMLAKFEIAELAGRAMDSLSGGQQQIVLIAQRLIGEPDLLLLDEPTSALDLNRQLAVFAILQAHAKATGAIVMAAVHDLTLALRQCDMIVLMRQGRIVALGPPQTVLDAANIRDVYRVEVDTYRNASGDGINVPVSAIPSASAAGGISSRRSHDVGQTSKGELE